MILWSSYPRKLQWWLWQAVTPVGPASKRSLSTSLQSQPAEPAPLWAIQNLSVLSLPLFLAVHLGVYQWPQKRLIIFFSFREANQTWGWKTAMPAKLGLNSRWWGWRGGIAAEAVAGDLQAPDAKCPTWATSSSAQARGYAMGCRSSPCPGSRALAPSSLL